MIPYIGFKPLRPMRIHGYCPKCGRRFSNMKREPYDPPKAVVMHLVCEKCGQGCKTDGPTGYLDAQGRWLFAEVTDE